MDHESFGRVARRVAIESSRRSALRVATGGAVAVVTAFGARSASAQVESEDHVQGRCSRRGEKCDGNPDCCNNLVCRNKGGRGGRCRRRDDGDDGVIPV